MIHLNQAEDMKEPHYNLQASSKDVSLWSRYRRIHSLVLSPIKPFVVILGPNSSTTALKKIIIDQMKVIW